MLLTISTTHQPATDLGYLLYKHPAKVQQVEIAGGKAHIFYPESGAERATVALLLDLDTIGMVRNHAGIRLEEYVNDRPYVASSFMSVALAKAFSTAMNGTCRDKPELVEVRMPFEVTLSVLPVSGGEPFLRRLFEPLGYQVAAHPHPLDATFPEWGESRYYTVKLANTLRLKDLLSHLYVLIPVLDNEKHYWLGEHEVQKLLEKGEGWLNAHPEKEQITRRYLKNLGSLTRQALGLLAEEAAEDTVAEEKTEALAEALPAPVREVKTRLHDQRLEFARAVLKSSGAKRVLDLGCGEGRLLQLLLKERQFEEILGMDVSHRSLQIAHDRLHLDTLPPRQKERITLLQGSLTYKDQRIAGYDAAAIVEVIEHLDLPRLASFEKVVFEFARPRTVVLTTPNAEYNPQYETLSAGTFRHSDHRFEWTRAEFETWAKKVANHHGYQVTFLPIGPEDEAVGAPSQAGIFTVN
ncbi:MAG: 3' terminal RNA ribose 2'-O-methyltransferase Hen1 [Ferruginibacter sp.]|nr:3' terminal RNA ribose 2'-O-methyltransferase Hen1 [Cytophagales bacterium]